MSRVVHFEIHATDPERAAVFYRAAFGWAVQKWDGPVEYWLISTGDKSKPGIDGGIMRRKGGPPVEGAAVNAYVCTLQIDNLEESWGRIEAAGGVNVVPTEEIPGVGRFAYFKDTEGNLFGCMQPAAGV